LEETIMKDWMNPDVFGAWDEAQKRLWESLSNILPASGSPQGMALWRESYLNNLAAWENAAKKVLDAETAWLEQLAGRIGSAEGFPEPATGLNQQMEGVMRRWIQAQNQLWGECFEMLRKAGVEVPEAPSIPGEALKSDPPTDTVVAPPGPTEPEPVQFPDQEDDDLKAITGIGPAMAKKLRDDGIVSYRRIAGLGEDEVERVESEVIKSKGRIGRDNWIQQARELHYEKYKEWL
jgi:predicted flap endonuclease-1-like 5' DNA nuclease